MASKRLVTELEQAVEAERIRQGDDPSGPTWTWITALRTWASFTSDQKLRRFGWTDEMRDTYYWGTKEEVQAAVLATC
jgi:hypothetical protein